MGSCHVELWGCIYRQTLSQLAIENFIAIDYHAYNSIAIFHSRSGSTDATSANSSHPVTSSHPFHSPPHPHSHTFPPPSHPPPDESLGHPLSWLPPTMPHGYLYDSEPASYLPPAPGLGLMSREGGGYSHPGPSQDHYRVNVNSEPIMPTPATPTREEVSGHLGETSGHLGEASGHSGHWSLGHRQEHVSVYSSHQQQVWYSDSAQAPPLQYNT